MLRSFYSRSINKYQIKNSNIKINQLVSSTGRTPETYSVKVPSGDSGSSPDPTYPYFIRFTQDYSEINV